ncbi:hypothetical protein PM082_021367 [Marasmius tenuissimus]|nr:hypothetical protein PM082_021367 [Marasmius tenuissimus]
MAKETIGSTSLEIPELERQVFGSLFVNGDSFNLKAQTTVGARLSSILGIPHFSLDKYYWEPGWNETPPDQFRAKVEKILSENENCWIIDGEYRKKGAGIVSEHATDIIWLDPPLLLYFPRVILRTILRLFRFEETCSPGCKESWQEAFCSKDSILLYCFTNHWPKRRFWDEQMAVMGVDVGSVPSSQQKLRRIGGWGSELRIWFEDVERVHRSI